MYVNIMIYIYIYTCIGKKKDDASIQKDNNNNKCLF